MMHLWAKWYIKAVAVVVAAVLGAFVSGILAHSWAIHIFIEDKVGYHYQAFGMILEPETAVLMFTLAGGIVGCITALLVGLFGYFAYRRFSKKLRLAQLKLLRSKWYVKAAMAAVVAVAVGVFTLGAWVEARVSALEQKVVTGSTGSIVPFGRGSSSLESRVSELESSVSALNRSTGIGRFSFGGSLESRVSDLESKVGGSYRGGLGGDLSSLERRVSALESKSGGSRFP